MASARPEWSEALVLGMAASDRIRSLVVTMPSRRSPRVTSTASAPFAIRRAASDRRAVIGMASTGRAISPTTCDHPGRERSALRHAAHEVDLREHAEALLAVHDEQVAQPGSRHQAQSRGHLGIRGDPQQVRAHDVRDRWILGIR